MVESRDRYWYGWQPEFDIDTAKFTGFRNQAKNIVEYLRTYKRLNVMLLNQKQKKCNLLTNN